MKVCTDCGSPRSRGSSDRCRRCADRVRKRKPDGTPFKPALELTGEEKSRAAALIRRHRLACPKCEDCKRGVCEYEARQVVFLERDTKTP